MRLAEFEALNARGIMLNVLRRQFFDEFVRSMVRSVDAEMMREAPADSNQQRLREVERCTLLPPVRSGRIK